MEEGTRVEIAADDPCGLSPKGRQGHELSMARAMRTRGRPQVGPQPWSRPGRDGPPLAPGLLPERPGPEVSSFQFPAISVPAL